MARFNFRSTRVLSSHKNWELLSEFNHSIFYSQRPKRIRQAIKRERKCSRNAWQKQQGILWLIWDSASPFTSFNSTAAAAVVQGRTNWWNRETTISWLDLLNLKIRKQSFHFCFGKCCVRGNIFNFIQCSMEGNNNSLIPVTVIKNSNKACVCHIQKYNK